MVNTYREYVAGVVTTYRNVSLSGAYTIIGQAVLVLNLCRSQHQGRFSISNGFSHDSLYQPPCISFQPQKGEYQGLHCRWHRYGFGKGW